MTISKEAVEAAARAMCDDGCNWDNKLPGHRKTMWLDRAEIALKAALPFLALRPAPIPSDEKGANKWIARAKDIALKFRASDKAGYKGWAVIHQALAEATLAGAAAEREWNKPNIDAIREAKDEDLRTLRAAKDRKIAALREALTLANQFLHPGNVELGVQIKIDAALAAAPAPDPAEAIRARCEAICQRVMQNWRDASSGTGAVGIAYSNQASGAEQCLNAIAALKGNGEGL